MRLGQHPFPASNLTTISYLRIASSCFTLLHLRQTSFCAIGRYCSTSICAIAMLEMTSLLSSFRRGIRLFPLVTVVLSVRAVKPFSHEGAAVEDTSTNNIGDIVLHQPVDVLPAGSLRQPGIGSGAFYYTVPADVRRLEPPFSAVCSLCWKRELTREIFVFDCEKDNLLNRRFRKFRPEIPPFQHSGRFLRVENSLPRNLSRFPTRPHLKRRGCEDLDRTLAIRSSPYRHRAIRVLS